MMSNFSNWDTAVQKLHQANGGQLREQGAFLRRQIREMSVPVNIGEVYMGESDAEICATVT